MPRPLAILVLLSALGAIGTEACAQPAVRDARIIQAGLGLLPGAGAQAGLVLPRNFYVLEGGLFLYTSPGFLRKEADVQVALGTGAALRPLGIVETITGATYFRYGLDVGIRFGPGLTFAVEETLADRNKRFSLVFEPYARVSGPVWHGQTLFVEAGLRRPYLRGGLFFQVGG